MVDWNVVFQDFGPLSPFLRHSVNESLFPPGATGSFMQRMCSAVCCWIRGGMMALLSLFLLFLGWMVAAWMEGRRENGGKVERGRKGN